MEEKKEQKRHQPKHSGPKAQKKNKKKLHGTEPEQDERKRNPRAFSVKSAVRMAKTFHRSVLRKLHSTLLINITVSDYSHAIPFIPITFTFYN